MRIKMFCNDPPIDPIRDWVEKKVKRINEKYAWAEEL